MITVSLLMTTIDHTESVVGKKYRIGRRREQFPCPASSTTISQNNDVFFSLVDTADMKAKKPIPESLI